MLPALAGKVGRVPLALRPLLRRRRALLGGGFLRGVCAALGRLGIGVGRREVFLEGVAGF